MRGSPGKSQKEGQEDQMFLKQLGGVPLALLPLRGRLGLPSGSSLGALSINPKNLLILQPVIKEAYTYKALKGLEGAL